MSNHTPYPIGYFKVPPLVSNARLGKWETAFVFIDGKLLDRDEQMQYLIDHIQIAKTEYVETEGLLLNYNGSTNTLVVVSNQLNWEFVNKFQSQFLELCANANDDPQERFLLLETMEDGVEWLGDIDIYIKDLKKYRSWFLSEDVADD